MSKREEKRLHQNTPIISLMHHFFKMPFTGHAFRRHVESIWCEMFCHSLWQRAAAGREKSKMRQCVKSPKEVNNLADLGRPALIKVHAVVQAPRIRPWSLHLPVWVNVSVTNYEPWLLSINNTTFADDISAIMTPSSVKCHCNQFVFSSLFASRFSHIASKQLYSHIQI